jgi:hypothetical protein
MTHPEHVSEIAQDHEDLPRSRALVTLPHGPAFSGANPRTDPVVRKRVQNQAFTMVLVYLIVLAIAFAVPFVLRAYHIKAPG